MNTVTGSRRAHQANTASFFFKGGQSLRPPLWSAPPSLWPLAASLASPPVRVRRRARQRLWSCTLTQWPGMDFMKEAREDELRVQRIFATCDEDGDGLLNKVRHDSDG